MSAVNDVVDQGLRALDPRAPGKAAAKATDQQVGFQREALDYLKESEALPMQFRDEALQAIGGFYGLGGQDGNQYMQQLMKSPMYQQAIQQGEDAIMRNANATGGFRSGNVQQALMNNPMQINQQYLSGLSGLAGRNASPGIANQLNQMGQTLAQGTIGQHQSNQAGWGNAINTGMALYGMFSDARLKGNVRHLGEVDGVNLYEWDWNERARTDLGLEGSARGVMAHEVNEDALSLHESGYLVVDYSKVK